MKSKLFSLASVSVLFVGLFLVGGLVATPVAHAWDCGATNPTHCAHVTVKVNVDNTSGGTAASSAFTVTITGDHPNPSTFPGSSTGTVSAMGTGSFSVSAAPVANYTLGYSHDCSGTLSNGDSKTCTITVTFSNPNNGSITVCKVLENASGTIVDGSAFPGQTFTVAGVSSIPSTTDPAAGVLPSTTFTTPLTLNTKLFGSSVNNAQCVTYDHLAIGHFYYGQESMLSSSSSWATPQYNDQDTVTASSPSNTFSYSGQLFDNDASNDAARNTNADGDIFLTAARPVRQLIVVNQFTGKTTVPPPPPVCSVNGLYGTFNNLPSNHPDVEGAITGVTTGTTPFQYDWYAPQYFSFATTTAISSLNQSSNYFPVNDGLPGDPFYTAIHWTGYVTFPASGTYPISVGSDDDSWVYINGQLVDAVPGVHPFATATSSVTVSAAGTQTIDLYFAERHKVQSGFVFQMNGVTFSPCAPVTTSTPSADIAIVKTADVTSTVEGGTINYTLNVSALGPSTSTGVIATDVLPSGVTFVSATTSVGSYATSTGTWTVGDMSASSSASLVLTVTANAGTAGTTISNTAVVSENASTTDSNPGNNSSTVTVVIPCVTNCGGGGGGGTPTAEIGVAKSVDNATPSEGATIHYTVTVSALGPSTSPAVVATDTLPAGVTFVSASTTAGNYVSSTGAWTVGTMNANTSSTLVITATVNAGTAGQTITNNASVGESNTVNDPTTTNNTANATITVAGGNGGGGGTPAADISIVKTVDNANPAGGAQITYTIKVSDLGTQTSTNVDAMDQLPMNVSLVSATATVGTYNLSTGDWTIGNVSPSSTETLVLVVVVDPRAAGTAIANTATVTELSSLPDNLANNSSTVTVNVQPVGCTVNCGGGGGGGGGSAPTAEIGVTKTVDNATPNAGDTIHYTVTVAASGPSASIGVVANDQLPTGVTFVSASTTAGNYNASTGVWTIGSMIQGQSVSLVITATVNAGTNGQTIANTGTVTESTSVVDQNSGNNSSTATINVGGNGGGGGGGGGNGGGGGGGGSGTGTGGQVLGASCGLYLRTYIHPIRKDLNDPSEVKKLQVFLNMNLGLHLNVSGDYDVATIAAVDQFQVKYHIEVLQPWVPYGLPTEFTPTQYVYKTTQRWINLIMCSSLNIPQPQLP